MLTAQMRWESLNAKRDGVLQRARACAELTIPALMPPEGSTENTILSTPYQSLGARGLNNLASKLLLSLLPPGIPFFRFQPEDDVLAEMGADRKALEEAMRKLENRGMKRIESGNLRIMAHSALKHLIAVGNACLHMPTNGKVRMYRLNQYCVLRDAQGTVVEAVIKECVHPSTLKEETRAACMVGDYNPSGKNRDADQCDVYTLIKLRDGKIEYHQEINDHEVPNSRGRNKAEESPYIFLRWTAVENENYGRGLVEEYLGDLRSLEGLSKAIISFAAVAAKIVLLLHPNSSTDEDKLIKAESGDVVTGNAEDIDILQLDKFADFRVAKEVVDQLTIRISHAFLLQSGTTRDAERVTAAEIAAMAQELEDVLGGVYSVLSQELQLPIVRRVIASMKANNQFPKFPSVGGKPAIEPIIVTGFDALGRGHELNRLRMFFADLAQTNPNALERFDDEKIARVYATSHNIDIEELLLSKADFATKMAQRQTAALVDKAAAPVAGAVAKSMTQT